MGSHGVDPMDAWYSPRDSPVQNTGVGSLSLLQGIFPTQGLNPGLPHCRLILYQLSHKGSSRRGVSNMQIGKSEILGFPGGSVAKKLPANAGDPGSIPGSGRCPGEGNGSYSSILAREIPWSEEPGGLHSTGSQRSWTQLSNQAATKSKPLQVLLT